MRMIDWFDKGADLGGGAPLFETLDGDVFTYGAVKDESNRIAAVIAKQAGSGQAHVAVYSPNDPRAFTCMLAGWRAGAAWVPINARNTAEGNIDFMNTAEVTWLFYHSSFSEAVEQAKKDVPTLAQCVCIDKALNGDPSMADVAADGASLPVPDVPHDPYRISGILGTGGTTGKSKGVVLHDLAWETMISTGWHMMPYEERPVHLLVAPMTHAAGVFNLMLLPKGAKTVALQKMDPVVVMQAIEKYKVTHLFLPPTALYALLAHPDVRNYDYSSLRYFLLAAAPVSPDKFKEAAEVFGAAMCQSWGQAEAPMFLTWLPPEDVQAAARDSNLAHRLTSCGRITMLSRVGVIDDDGNEVPQGETGELAMQGNLRMTGYYKNPEATAEIRTENGWQRTGDMGYKDEDGYVYIVDRKKDMIISGGFNVYSVEVEKAVNSHPAVEDCAVFGVPHEKWGEMVKAVVQLKPGQSVAEEDLIAHCKDKVGSVMAPKAIDFMESLPRSPVGKVLKRDLRAPYWQGAGRGVN